MGEAMSDDFPKRYDGRPYLCTACGMYYTRQHCERFNVESGPAYQAYIDQIKITPGKDCKLETKDAAMERRAHWLLARQFDPALTGTKFK